MFIMLKKLQYDFEVLGNSSKKVMVAIHGWQGSRESMKPLIRSLNMENVGWYFLEAPYPLDSEKKKFSWSYEISDGKWEVNEPRYLLNDFFNDLFKEYSSRNIYVIGFSQGGLVCIDFVLFLNKPLGGVFSVAGFSRNPKEKIKRCHPCQLNTPIILAHGIEDDQVPVSASIHIYEQLIEQGAKTKLLLYNGKHKIGVECLREIKKIFLN